MAIKAIIVDCFGVLVIPGKNYWYQTHPQLINEIDDLQHQMDYGIITQSEFYVSMSSLLGVDSRTVESKYLERVRNEPMFDLIRKLKQSRKYKIGMLSNAGHGGTDKFISAGEKKEVFDKIIVSADVGMAKPEIAIFELMTDQLNLDSPSDCVMIDDMPINIEGARNSGMYGILHRSNEQTHRDLNRLLGINNA